MEKKIYFYNISIFNKRILPILFTSFLLFPILTQNSYAACTRSTIYDTSFSPPLLLSFNPLSDNDCDQIPNTWEQNGLDLKLNAAGHIVKTAGGNLDTDGVIDINFPALGANLNHKDIFLEIDYMTGHNYWADAISNVKSAFARASVVNPDGLPGIKVYIDTSAGGSHVIPHKDCTNMWNEFYGLKSLYLGTAAEKSLPNFGAIKIGKINTFHYGILIHEQCANFGSSGAAELPGNDFAVSLGGSSWGSGPTGHIAGSRMQQESTIMHEIGHNFNLKHGGGGSTADINCKPQYLSVMNYLYQFEYPNGFRNWPIPAGAASSIDYARHYMNSLQENNLNEVNGLVKSTPAGLIAVYGPYAPSYTYTTSLTSTWNVVNWDKDAGSGELNSIANINYFDVFGNKCTTGIESSPYFGYTDWAGLNYWGTSGNYSTGAPSIQNDIASSIQNALVDNNTSNNISKVMKQVDPLMVVNNLSIVHQSENQSIIQQISPCDPNDPTCISPPPCHQSDQECYPRPFASGWDEYNVNDLRNVRNSHLMDIYDNINSLQKIPTSNNTSNLKFNMLIQDILSNISGSNNSTEILLYNDKIDEAIYRLNSTANSLYEIKSETEKDLNMDSAISQVIAQISAFIKGLEENK